MTLHTTDPYLDELVPGVPVGGLFARALGIGAIVGAVLGFWLGVGSGGAWSNAALAIYAGVLGAPLGAFVGVIVWIVCLALVRLAVRFRLTGTPVLIAAAIIGPLLVDVVAVLVMMLPGTAVIGVGGWDASSAAAADRLERLRIVGGLTQSAPVAVLGSIAALCGLAHAVFPRRPKPTGAPQRSDGVARGWAGVGGGLTVLACLVPFLLLAFVSVVGPPASGAGGSTPAPDVSASIIATVLVLIPVAAVVAVALSLRAVRDGARPSSGPRLTVVVLAGCALALSSTIAASSGATILVSRASNAIVQDPFFQTPVEDDPDAQTPSFPGPTSTPSIEESRAGMQELRDAIVRAAGDEVEWSRAATTVEGVEIATTPGVLPEVEEFVCQGSSVGHLLQNARYSIREGAAVTPVEIADRIGAAVLELGYEGGVLSTEEGASVDRYYAGVAPAAEWMSVTFSGPDRGSAPVAVYARSWCSP